MKIEIDKIQVGDRYRKDVGDLHLLADSIAKIGLLQPIGVVPRGPAGRVELVFGERRLLACRDILGLTEIEVRMLDISDLLEKEQDENEVRKDFTVSERTAIAAAIEREIGQRQGQRTDKQLVQNIAQVPAGQKTRDFAAEKAGFGNRETYRQAKSVVEHGTPELVDAMDSNVVSIHTASKLAKKEPSEQRQALQDAEAMDRTLTKMEEDLEASRSDIHRVQEVVNAFTDIGKTRLGPGEFTFKANPVQLDDIREVLPRVQEFISAVEGAGHDTVKSHLKTV